LFILVATEQVHQQHLLLILQCHQVAQVAQQVVVLLIQILIGILFVVILVVIIHKFLAQVLNQLLMHSTLQDKRVQVVAELFKADNSPIASTLLCSRAALRQWLYHVLLQMVTVALLHVQTVTLI
jgi:hypothetical protein